MSTLMSKFFSQLWGVMFAFWAKLEIGFEPAQSFQPKKKEKKKIKTLKATVKAAFIKS